MPSGRTPVKIYLVKLMGTPARIAILCLSVGFSQLAPACSVPPSKEPPSKSSIQPASKPIQTPRAVKKLISRPIKTKKPRPKPLPAHRPPTELHVRIFAAGHGDSILLRTPSGHVVLIDAGRGNEAFLGDNLARRRLVPHLQQLGIRKLDAFFITHPHWDHFGDPVSLQRAVSFAKIYTNLDGHHLLSHWLHAPLPGMTYVTLYRGQHLTFGKLRLDVLNPAQNALSPQEILKKRQFLFIQNNRSLVLRATYGKIRFLFAGDVHKGGEQHLLARGLPGRAHVLKMGHHGRGSTSTAWLRAIRPRYAVATCGDKWRKRWDYLPWKTRVRLARRRIKLLRTDRHGDILFTTNGTRLQVRTFPELRHVPTWARRASRSFK